MDGGGSRRATGNALLSVGTTTAAAAARRKPERRIVLDPLEAKVDVPSFKEWVHESLRKYEEVELLGFDPGLADCIAILLTMKNDGIVRHRDIRTTTIVQNKSPRSCISAHLVRGPSLERELELKKKATAVKEPGTDTKGKKDSRPSKST
ncbi:hypothetical protein HDU85_002997 [Gaertneriomyces sp. JEL0708]|nr:hypothetical protein HDU85_002997 [Gaertneriomyces sp. JEL0708]